MGARKPRRTRASIAPGWTGVYYRRAIDGYEFDHYTVCLLDDVWKIKAIEECKPGVLLEFKLVDLEDEKPE